MRLSTTFCLVCFFSVPLACGGDDASSTTETSSGGASSSDGSAASGESGGASGSSDNTATAQAAVGGTGGNTTGGAGDTATNGNSTTGAAGEAAGGSDSTASGGAAGSPGTTTSASTTTSTTGGGCPDVQREECEWETFGGLACDAAACCGTVSCLEDRCLSTCTNDSTSADTLLPDFHLLAQVCGVQGSVSVLRQDGSCQRPIIYQLGSSYDMQDDSFVFTVSRVEPSVNATWSSSELVQTVSWPSPGGSGSAVPATFGVNPSETKAIFTATLDTYESTSFELDLTTGTTRTLPGYLTDRMVWLDDSHYLVCALALGTHTPGAEQGVYHVDTSGGELEPTYVAGRFDCGALGIVADEQLVIGGSPIVGGTDPALLSVPLSIIDEVVAGSRAAIDAYSDAAVQRIPRAVWELQGFFPGGRWFVSPANSEYTEYRIEALSLNAGALELGTPTQLGKPDIAGFTPLYAGYDRLLMLDFQQAILVDFR